MNKKIITLILFSIFLMCVVQGSSHGGFFDNFFDFINAFVNLIVDLAEGVVKIAEGVANLSIRIVGTVLWDTGSLTNITPASHDGGIFGVIVSSNIHLWDTVTRQTLNTFTYTSNLTNTAFSLDGLLIASGSDDNTVQLWNTNTLQLIAKLIGHTDSVLSVSFSPDGSMLASAGADGSVKLWDPETFENVGSLGGHTDIVRSIKFSPDGSILASAGNDHTIQFWNPQTQTRQTTLFGHTGTILSLAFSADGSMLASASEDGTVRVWDTENNQELAALDNESPVDSVDFSPDGKLIATGTQDGVARLWDSETKTVLATLGHESPVKNVAFAKAGSMLMTGSADNKMRLWEISEETEESEDLISNRTLQVRVEIRSELRSEDPTIRYTDITAAHLANITTLNLNNKNITSLKVDDFDGLTSLQTLRLDVNRLTSLPVGIFDDNTSLSNLNLYRNQLSSLPDGIFEGKTSLTTLRLGRNAVDPLPIFVSLEKVADGQFKAVVPTGATFNYVLPITVTNGSINGGTTTLMIPHGSVESGVLTVTRTAGTTANVTVNIATLPSLPRNHYGYALVKSTDLPLEVIRATATQRTGVNIPDVNLRATIESALRKTSGATISATEMATLTSLNAQDASITNLTGLQTATNLTTLKLGDNTISDISALASLTSLTELQLWDNQISNLSDLSGLTNLTTLYLWGNNISDISDLSGLTSLTHLRLGENRISNISTVSNLTNLTQLYLNENSITDISAVTGLTSLTELVIGRNTISDITPVQNLTNLEWLDMPNNSISDISAVQNLTAVVELYFQNNSVSDLSPLVGNTGFGEFTEIDMRGNPLSYPSIYTHIPALQAKDVYIDFDNRVAAALVKISGDTQQGNIGTALALPFVVEVRDGISVVFAGVPVTFAVTAGGGTISRTNTTTDMNGRAETTLTLGNTVGTNTAHVSVTGITQTIIFTATAITAPIVTVSPIASRTPQVQDAIVDALPGINSANDVTEAHLRTITHLNLTNKNISTLKDGDFDGLSALTELRLQQNRLTTLPDNIFSDLLSLRTLYLNNNRLSSLPSTVFLGLSSLSNLYMNNNRLASLPETVFSGLTSLRQINMHTNLLTTLPVNVFSGLSSLIQISINNNRLTSLPQNVFSGRTGLVYIYLDGNRLTSLPANLFSGLSALEQLKFNNNRLSSLPAGLFSGLSSLTWLLVQGNTVNPLPFTVSLEKVGTNQFKATAPVGAPFTMTIPVTIVNGSISSSTSTLTIPAGNVESQSLTVTRTLGTTGAVTVNIGTLPGLPTQHQGYELAKSATLPLTIFNALNNNAPIFTEGTSTTRTIAENTISGVNIGIPVSATDANNDTLTYSLSGTDTASFDIDTTNGQLQTLATLDYETKSTYTVTITVSDGDLTDTITVTVNITDIDELPTDSNVCMVGDILTPGQSCTYPDSDAVFSVLDNGNSRWNIPDLPSWLQWINQISIGGSMRITSTINGKTYHFVAESVANNSWEIKEIGDDKISLPTPPDTLSLSVSAVPPLTEATLHEGTITLTLTDGVFASFESQIKNAITMSGITGVTVDTFGVDRVSDTEVTVELEYDGNMTTNGNLTVSLGADAIVGYEGAALTSQIAVTAVTESVTASPSTLTEATLDGTEVSLTLSGRIFERFNSDIRDAVSVSGISGVTFPWHDPDKDSDTKITMKLDFDGDMTSDGTLTFTVGADAIAGYNGPALTAQVSVSATGTTTPSNRAPVFTDGSSTTRSVAENTASGVHIGTPVAATDADGNTLTYTLGGTDAASFSIVSSSGQLQTSAPLNYETKTSYSVTVSVSDGNGGSDSIIVTINITDVNENIPNRAPVFTDGSSTTRSIAENTASGVHIGTPVSATDADGNTLTYSLGGTDAASFSIVSSSGQLQTKAPLDYETKTSYLVTVSVSDGNGGSDSIIVTINITDVNENIPNRAPVFTDGSSTTRSIAENTASGVNIGTPVSATDADGNTLTYSLGGTDAASFSIVSSLGQLQTKAPLDYETKTSYLVTVSVSDGNGGSDSISITINITDVTETQTPTNGTPSISVSAGTTLTEATLHGNKVTLKLTGGTYESFSWNYQKVSTSGITGVTFDDFFDVDRESDTELTVELTFDGNMTTDGTLTFTVDSDAIVDYDGSALTAQISVSAVSESVTASPSTLTEATLDGTEVTLTLSGRIFESFIFDIRDAVSVSGISSVTFPWHDPDKDSDTEITMKLDFDGDMTSDGTLTFTVGADAIVGYNGPELTAQVSVSATGTTTPSNRAPVFTGGSSTTRSVAENTASGVHIGTPVSATDADGNTLTYTLGGTDAASFSIVSSSGQLQTSAALDYETKTSYSVTVSVSDGNGGSDSITVTINVTDVNETPNNNVPMFTDGTSTTRSIAENTASGQNIGSAVAATDVDNDTLTYTLGGTDAASFSIVSSSGQLQTSAALDYETKTSYTVTVSVSDGNGGSDSITVTINVTDVNETPNNNVPMFTDGTSTTRSIAENTASGQNIGSAVAATDVDNDTLTYTLGGTDAASFSIVSSSGQLQTSAALDYETKTSYSVTVSVSDGNGGSDSITVTINVTDVHETLVTPTINVSTTSSLTEATLHGGVITLKLSGGVYEGAFWDYQKVSISGITGVTFDDFFDVDRESDTELTVKLTFDGNMTTDGTLTFTVDSDAIVDYDGSALTAQISVSAVSESVTASPSTLTEATLDGKEVTLTLSGRKFESFIFDIRDAVSVSGISGVTFPWHDPDKESDTEITMKLDFDGDMTSDGTLTFTVGADAIVGYNGPELTAQVSVTADRANVLLASFPNPFNPETWIPYKLAKPTDVTITIYAVNGTFVRTLSLGHQAAGMYQSRSRAAYWDGRNQFGETVASGLYFYTLTAGEFSATRKMLIRK